MVTISRFERLQGLTNDWRDVETAEVGCWAVIDFTFCVQMAISIIGGTASFPQTVHVHPVTWSLWLGWISMKIKQFISNLPLINNNRKAASYFQIPSTGQFSQKQRVSFKSHRWCKEKTNIQDWTTHTETDWQCFGTAHDLRLFLVMFLFARHLSWVLTQI